MTGIHDTWDDGSVYERYMGRWSRPIAREFIDWLAPRGRERWLDVGCGTGALAAAIAADADPMELHAVDLSEEFVLTARRRLPVYSVTSVADGERLSYPDARFDRAVSGLALNFYPNPPTGMSELTRVVRPGGRVGVFVWDYAEGMEMIRIFWDVAASLDPDARALDEAVRFPLCDLDRLTELAETSLTNVRADGLIVSTIFEDFDDYWAPFLGGQGPAPSYVSSLADDPRNALRDELRARLGSGRIALTARAWAVDGQRPD